VKGCLCAYLGGGGYKFFLFNYKDHAHAIPYIFFPSDKLKFFLNFFPIASTFTHFYKIVCLIYKNIPIFTIE